MKNVKLLINKFFFCVICFLFINVPIKANTYYLNAISGNDTFPGTAAQPWQTLSHSISVVTSGDSVILSNGNYGSYTENLSTVSRTNWVTYIAAIGQTAVIFDNIDVDGLDVNAYLYFKDIDVLYPAQPSCPPSGNAIDIASFAGVNFVTMKNCKIHGVNTYDSGGGVNFNHILNPYVAVHDLVIDSCEIFQTATGIRFSGSKTTITNCNIHHIHGTIIGNLCGRMSATDFNSATNVLIENNHLHDMHFYTTEPCYKTPNWSTAHASLIGIRGHDWIVRGNHMHDTWSPVIQLYGNDCGGIYDKGNILFENNIIYDNQGYFLFYNPGQNSNSYIGGEIVFRHNTIISGRQDSLWTTADPSASRFYASGTTQSSSLNLFPSPPNPYDGLGTIYEDNIFILATRLGNFNYQNFSDTTAKWIARNNLIYIKGWNSGTLAATNFIISDSITALNIPVNFIDTMLFLAANFNKQHALTHTTGSTFDLTPKPGSIICTMSTTGNYIGAIPCINITNINNLPISILLSVFPNPATETLNISLLKNQNQKTQLQIFNAMGMLLKEISITQSSQIDISDLPSGLYFVHLKDNSAQAQKFIKQ